MIRDLRVGEAAVPVKPGGATKFCSSAPVLKDIPIKEHDKLGLLAPLKR